jgi:hypothetical protein
MCGQHIVFDLRLLDNFPMADKSRYPHISYQESEIKQGIVLDTGDFDGVYEGARPVHINTLVGSTDPQIITAYWFLKQIESGSLSYKAYFDKFGFRKPDEIENFDFILRYAFRLKSPERKWIRDFFRNITKHVESLSE